MRTERKPKTEDQKELDHLWGVMQYAVQIREVRLCQHLIGQINMVSKKSTAPAEPDKPRARRPGRPRKVAADVAGQEQLKLDANGPSPSEF